MNGKGLVAAIDHRLECGQFRRRPFGSPATLVHTGEHGIVGKGEHDVGKIAAGIELGRETFDQRRTAEPDLFGLDAGIRLAEFGEQLFDTPRAEVVIEADFTLLERRGLNRRPVLVSSRT